MRKCQDILFRLLPGLVESDIDSMRLLSREGLIEVVNLNLDLYPLTKVPEVIVIEDSPSTTERGDSPIPPVYDKTTPMPPYEEQEEPSPMLYVCFSGPHGREFYGSNSIC